MRVAKPWKKREGGEERVCTRQIFGACSGDLYCKPLVSTQEEDAPGQVTMHPALLGNVMDHLIMAAPCLEQLE
jgi:hypothetical protein